VTSLPIPETLASVAVAILMTADPAAKVRLTREAGERLARDPAMVVGQCAPPDRPARPERPLVLLPKEMPKRSYKGVQGRVALLHALAHIELNAIDLAWDIIARFTAEDLPAAFFADWVTVAIEEAAHFEMLDGLLHQLESSYGALPAHDGLWQAATKTADDLLARLALVPMLLEARGVDTTPATIAKLTRHGDLETVAVLEVIYRDEISHVATGCRWFSFLAERRGLEPGQAYAHLIRQRFPAGLKPPFNHEARAQARFPRDWYEPLAAGPS